MNINNASLIVSDARVRVGNVMDNTLSAVKEKESNKVTSRVDDNSVITT